MGWSDVLLATKGFIGKRLTADTMLSEVIQLVDLMSKIVENSVNIAIVCVMAKNRLIGFT